MNLENRASFLNLAGGMQGGVVVAALLLGAWADLSPLAAIRWNWTDAAVGVVAIVPMLLVFAGATKLRRLVVDLLGGPLSRCTWYDLVLLAALAGFGEELLFRGVLQPWIGEWHPWAGLILANLIFGLLHALTPGYAVVACLFGFYLSWLNSASGEPNLLRPIVTHAVYDYVAFLLVVRDFRRREITPPDPMLQQAPESPAED